MKNNIKNTISIFCLCCIAFSSMAQRRTGADLIRGGLVKIGFGAGASFLLNPSVSSANINGELEIYLHRRVSLRGDVSFNVPTPESGKVLAHNHSLFWGFNYHIPYKRLDFLIGLQPGLSIVQSYKEDGNPTIVQGIPVITALAGCQFYVTRFFHFYITSRFIAGTYFRNADTPLSMMEVRVMTGVGFHVNMVPLKRKEVELN